MVRCPDMVWTRWFVKNIYRSPIFRPFSWHSWFSLLPLLSPGSLSWGPCLWQPQMSMVLCEPHLVRFLKTTAKEEKEWECVGEGGREGGREGWKEEGREMEGWIHSGKTPLCAKYCLSVCWPSFITFKSLACKKFFWNDSPLTQT